MKRIFLCRKYNFYTKYPSFSCYKFLKNRLKLLTGNTRKFAVLVVPGFGISNRVESTM